MYIKREVRTTLMSVRKLQTVNATISTVCAHLPTNTTTHICYCLLINVFVVAFKCEQSAKIRKKCKDRSREVTILTTVRIVR